MGDLKLSTFPTSRVVALQLPSTRSCTLPRVQYKEFLYHSGRYKNSLCSCSFLYDSYYLWPHKTLQNEPHSVCYCLSMSPGFIHFHLTFIHCIKILQCEQFTRQPDQSGEFLRSSLNCTVPTLLGGAKFA